MTVDEKGDVMQLISSLSRGFFRLLVEAALVLLADAMMEAYKGDVLFFGFESSRRRRKRRE